MTNAQKKVGIIGGLSPESTVKYYEWINEGVKKQLGGHHSAKILLSSVDFGEFVALKEKNDWDTQAELLCKEAQSLEKAGADFIILATNTMHKVADQIEAAIKVPFLHLADATAENIIEDNIKTVGLLGTRYTMELDFYKKRLEQKGIKTLIPDKEDRSEINRIIYDELCHGKILEKSRVQYRNTINKLYEAGAEGIIMGCTEITTLIDKTDSPIPLYDTTHIHVQRTLDKILDKEK